MTFVCLAQAWRLARTERMYIMRTVRLLTSRPKTLRFSVKQRQTSPIGVGVNDFYEGLSEGSPPARVQRKALLPNRPYRAFVTERKRTPRPGDGGVDEFAGSERACLLGQDDHDLVKLAALRPMVSVPTLDCGPGN